MKTFFKSLNLQGVSADTIVRTIMGFLALINTICALLGWAPIDIDESQVYSCVTVILDIVVGIRVWWKNNDFTLNAQIGTGYKKQLDTIDKAGER